VRRDSLDLDEQPMPVILADRPPLCKARFGKTIAASMANKGQD